jgi:hypothetical protein
MSTCNSGTLELATGGRLIALFSLQCSVSFHSCLQSSRNENFHPFLQPFYWLSDVYSNGRQSSVELTLKNKITLTSFHKQQTKDLQNEF